MEQNQSIQNGIFNVLHILTQDKWDKQHKYAVLKVVVEWIQLFLLLVLPNYGWVIDQDSGAWQAVEWLQFRIPIANVVRVESLQHR